MSDSTDKLKRAASEAMKWPGVIRYAIGCTSLMVILWTNDDITDAKLIMLIAVVLAGSEGLTAFLKK